MAGTNAKQKSVRNMVLSLAVTILAAGVVYLFIPHEESAPDLKRVDYRVELLTARRAASYPVVAPEGLAKEWKATSVRFRGDESDAWHLGFHAPDGEYVQIRQSAARKVKPFLDDATQGARATKATQEVDGTTWTRWTGGRYDALVLQEDGATTVVAGTGSFAQLAEMAGALKAE
ncbi:DUF4245 domain-containing protein [Streptomyces sp. YS415]|uniref:DUF4245 domain-containing protein n=1 Tax=Streptomyces sp. YS415 TaxID=2944806 RepID=UPI0020200B17|nr:DUF4245 domain-containing protein [Streptomyces sp. YS415]MCL7428540.1 DUF4245 domain-containing protein [Streptomyces sp. YS415]